MSNLTDRIDNLIKMRGLGKYEFYDAVGISSATYSQWKAGAYNPRMGKLREIAEYFGVPLAELLQDEETAAPKSDGLSNEQVELLSIIQKLDPDSVRFLLAKARELLEFRTFRDAQQ